MSAKARRLLAGAALAAFAVAYLYVCGQRRFVMSVSFAYTGGFEVLSGRFPYSDFYIVVGPVIFLLQAFFFKLFGLSYLGGYLAHAAALNALGTAMVWDAAWRRTKSELLAAGAGLLTAIWFYAIYHASPWYDQEAFFFLIGSAWMIARADGKRQDAWLFAAGVCGALSFFTKQSQGAPGIAALALYLLAARGARPAGVFAAGAAAGGAALAGLCASWGGWTLFWEKFVALPMRAGRLGFAREPAFWVGAALVAPAFWLWKPLRELRILAPALALAVGAVAASDRVFAVFLVPAAFLPWLSREDRALVVALCLTQLGGRVASHNEIKLFWPFIGLLYALVAHGLRANAGESWLGLSTPRALLRSWLALGFAGLLLLGLRLSYYHMRHSPFPATTWLAAAFCLALSLSLLWAERRRFRQLCAAAALAALAAGLSARATRAYSRNLQGEAYAESLRLRHAESELPAMKGARMTEQEARSLDALVAHLNALPEKRKPVFLYAQCDLVYALIGQKMPQPELWFDPTLTFRADDGTQEKMLAELEKSRVRTVVLCEPVSDLEMMPRLQETLARRGSLELSLPLYKVYRLDAPAR